MVVPPHLYEFYLDPTYQRGFEDGYKIAKEEMMRLVKELEPYTSCATTISTEVSCPNK